jgi:multidrug efflux pump subunit AcrB
VKDELRAMTKSDLIRDNAVVISSTTPSAKYSWAASQTVLKQLPPGITPPYVLSYNASTVPILQLALSSSELSQMKLFDSGQNFIRPQLAAVAGAAIPSPEGGKILQAQVDLDQHAMQANNVSADDVLNAISVQNLILPAEDQKIGKFDWNMALRLSMCTTSPMSTRGSSPQTNMVRVNGTKAVLMEILKAGSASTLDHSRGDSMRCISPQKKLNNSNVDLVMFR